EGRLCLCASGNGHHHGSKCNRAHPAPLRDPQNTEAGDCKREYLACLRSLRADGRLCSHERHSAAGQPSLAQPPHFNRLCHGTSVAVLFLYLPLHTPPQMKPESVPPGCLSGWPAVPNSAGSVHPWRTEGV